MLERRGPGSFYGDVPRPNPNAHLLRQRRLQEIQMEADGILQQQRNYPPSSFFEILSTLLTSFTARPLFFKCPTSIIMYSHVYLVLKFPIKTAYSNVLRDLPTLMLLPVRWQWLMLLAFSHEACPSYAWAHVDNVDIY